VRQITFIRDLLEGQREVLKIRAAACKHSQIMITNLSAQGHSQACQAAAAAYRLPQLHAIESPAHLAG